MEDFRNHSVEYHKTRLNAMFKYRGIVLTLTKKFNELYEKWIKTNDKWIKPSLDHIEAKSKGGSLLVDNLQFISWLENRAKIDIDKELWDKMKQNINYYL